MIIIFKYQKRIAECTDVESFLFAHNSISLQKKVYWEYYIERTNEYDLNKGDIYRDTAGVVYKPPDLTIGRSLVIEIEAQKFQSDRKKIRLCINRLGLDFIFAGFCKP